VQRANNRIACFLDSSDYLVYLGLLRQLITKLRPALHAYCLMTNHVHLLLTVTEQACLRRLMHGLGQRYACYFNRKYARTGTMWEGRFKSCIVDSSTYVLACYRYIEMNPVRAGIVAHAGDYPWSSFNENAGRATNLMLTPHAEYNGLSRKQYLELFEGALPEKLIGEIRGALNAGLPLGDERVKLQVAEMGGRAQRRKPGRPKRGEPESGRKSVTVPDLF
jgi:putative transposase